MDRTKRTSPIFAYVAFPLFLVAIVVLVVLFREQLGSFFHDRNAIRTWIVSKGPWAPLFFIALQVLQVVVFIIPGEIIQIAGGYVFSFWPGLLYSFVGIAAGSVVNFFVGRIMGRPFVESIFDSGKIAKVEAATGSGKGAAGFFLLFLIPGIPKDVLCYVAGFSSMGLPLFLAVSMTGRLPGLLGSAYMGSAAYSGSYRSAMIVLAVAALLFFVGLAFKDHIQTGVARFLDRRGKDGRG
jgi:Uncharacterized conserved protein